MKFTELTSQQQEHFLKMLEQVGEPPEETTHVDITLTSVQECWLKIEKDSQYFHQRFNWELATGDDICYDYYQLPEKPWSIPEQETISEEKITSDGGSSSYYDFYIPLDRVEINEDSGTVKIRLEDYIKFALDNDFDRGNLAKANHRIGKKAGNNLDYDTNKMQYYVGQIKKNCEG